MQKLTDNHLGFRILGPDLRHAIASTLRCKFVRHIALQIESRIKPERLMNYKGIQILW